MSIYFYLKYVQYISVKYKLSNIHVIESKEKLRKTKFT